MRLQEIAERIGAELRGDGETELTGVAAFTSATSSELIFLESSKYADAAAASSAGAFVVGQLLIAVVRPGENDDDRHCCTDDARSPDVEIPTMAT